MTRLVGFDLETTGVNPFSDLPVSYGFVELIESVSGVEFIHESSYVNPGVVIPDAATRVHGVTNEMVADALTLEDAHEIIVERLHEVWHSGGAIVGMNVSYDLTMVECLGAYLASTPLSQRGAIGPVFDVLIVDRHFDKWRKGPRKLPDLCVNYGVELRNAHRASDDAEAALHVLAAQRQRYSVIDTLALGDLNEHLRSWYTEWLSNFSLYREKQGQTAITKGQYEWPIHRGG
ncbi:MAG: exonuclease domain-containing protein [Acidimicrobiales bacterium]